MVRPLAYVRWKRVAEASFAANVVMAVGLAGFVFLHSTGYVAQARMPDGRLIEAQRLKEPIRTDVALRNWAVTAVTEAFTLSHDDWEERLEGLRPYFSESGHENFVRNVKGSAFLEVLRREFQVASAVVQGAPVIVDMNYLEDGRRAWMLEFPMLITFQAGRDSSRRRYVARVVVGRVPLDERRAGIGIEWVTATREKEA